MTQTGAFDEKPLANRQANSDQMKAATLTSDRRLEIVDFPRPEPTAGDEIVVKVEAAGVCGTDLHFVEGLLDTSGTPRVLGHEIAVTLTDSEDDLRAGDRFAVYNVLYCGACTYCHAGRERLCANSQGMLGFNVDGGFAEYVAVPRRNLIPLPDEITPDMAAVLACSGMSAVHAVRLSAIGLGDVVMVDGIGGVGLMLIQVAAAAGARVIAVGDHPDKLNMALGSGADDAILIAEEDEYGALGDELSDRWTRPKVFFETVGTTASMTAGYEVLAPGGSFVQIGYTSDRIDIHPSKVIKNELRLITSAAGSLADLETAIQLAASGAISASITRRDGLEELPAALDAIRDRTVMGRGVLIP